MKIHIPLLFLSLFSFLLLTTLPKSNSQEQETTTKYFNCPKQFKCGSLPPISFPFWDGVERPRYCGGKDEFKLNNCTDPNQYPFLYINSHKFQVFDIDIINYTMKMVRKYDDYETCDPPLSNNTLPPTLFKYNQNVYNITVFYNCFDDVSYAKKFTCSSNKNEHAYYVEKGGDSNQILELQRICENHSILQVLESGPLEPDDAWNCKRCGESNGICGRKDTDQYQFSCICHDGSEAPSSCPIHTNEEKKNVTVIVTTTVIIGTILIVACAYILWQRTRKIQEKTNQENQKRNEISSLSKVKLQEVSQYKFEKLVIATNNFHLKNKLGEGGFGPVYKGTLEDGQEIAVKRLSRASGQGLEEFMNEVIVISKLQHLNLVRLLGCCTDGDEKILIYEYMPNRSLDAYMFDPVGEVLSWEKRFKILEGIARGLLYLHRDSRLRIIHRDLKLSNILLDEELNPKISDFGMARIFGRSEDAANTNRVVGTYGYMSPEYAMEGLFSEKSDVFSFGVLLLEIVSRRKNNSFYEDAESFSLLGFAWKKWNDGNITSLIDPQISNPSFDTDILRCIHIGLLCVQEHAIDRPTMTKVVSMLNSETVNLPPPKQPAFIQRQVMLDVESSHISDRLFSINYVSLTKIQAR